MSSGNFRPMRRLKKYALRSSATATLSTLSPIKSQRTQPAPSKVRLRSFCEITDASFVRKREHRPRADVSLHSVRVDGEREAHASRRYRRLAAAAKLTELHFMANRLPMLAAE